MNNILLDRFDPNNMDMEVYIEQFSSYCLAYNIKEEKKVALFLSHIGHDLNSILKDLYAPENLQDQTFENI